MALTFNAPPSPDLELWQADHRLYLSADDRLVGEGDPDAAFLLVAAGGTLPLALAVRYGLVTPVRVPDAPPLTETTVQEVADAHGADAPGPDAGA